VSEVIPIFGPNERREFQRPDATAAPAWVWTKKEIRRRLRWRSARAFLLEHGLRAVVALVACYGLGLWAAFHLGAEASTLRAWAGLGVPLLAGAGLVVWGASLEFGRRGRS
jgi:hypothetical protein